MTKDVIGTAYVRIVAMSQDFEKQVAASFDRLKPVASKAGEDAAGAFNEGWTKGLGERMQEGHQKALDDMRDESRKSGDESGKEFGTAHGDSAHDEMVGRHQKALDTMTGQSTAGGHESGTAFGDSWSSDVERAMSKSIGDSQNLWRGSNLMKYTAEDIDKLFNDIMPNSAQRGAHQSGVGIEQELSKSFSNIGTGVSKMFSDMFGGGSGGGAFKFLTDGADEASKAFTVLFSMGQLVGSALVTLVAGIANVVAGLFAIVAAAGQAVDALAVIPGVIAAIAQAGIVLMVGFKGIGKAITEGLKLQPGMAGATQQASQLASAQRAVASASRSVTSAEQASVNAKKELANAQKNLNDAYKEGAKQLRDIQFASEDAQLQEEQSAIDLANARDNLAKVKATNPADSRAVQEAELQYKQADLAYREARARNKDASEASNDAMKKGVKGTQAVVSAQDRLKRAQDNVTNTTQRLADAQIALADAQKRLADTQSGALGSAKLYNDALKKFGPEGQKFIKTIVGMQKEFRGFKQAAGEGVFKALNDQLAILANGPFFPMIKRNFAATSTALGGVVTSIGKVITNAKNMSAINDIMKGNTTVIGNMGKGAAAIVQIFISMIHAAQPLTKELSKWAAVMLQGWAATMKAQDESGTLTKKFQAAAGVAKQLWRIISNVAGALFHTGQSATGAGHVILDATEKASKKWNEWTKSVSGKKSLKEYFDNVAKSFVPIMEGINAIVKELFKLGGNTKLTGGIGPVLKEIATWIAPVGEQVAAAMPGLQALAHNIGLIFVALQKSDALNTFVDVLVKVTGFFASLTGSGPAQGFLNLAGGVMGVTRALRFMILPLSFILKAIVGKDIKTAHAVWSGFGKLLQGKNPFSSTTKGSEEARKEFEKQMKVDALKKKAMEGIGSGAKSAAKHIKTATDESKKSRGTKILDKLGLSKSSSGDHERVGGAHAASSEPSRGRRVAGKIGKGLAIGGGAIGAAVGIFAGLAALNKDSAKALGDQITGLVKNLPTAIAAIAGQIPSLINSIAAALPGVIDAIVKALPGIINGLVAAVPKVIDALATALPIVLDAIVKLIPTIITALVTLIPKLIQMIVTVVPKLIITIVKALPTVIVALVKAIPVIIVALVKAIPQVITALVGAVPELITAIIKAIPDIIGALIAAIPDIIGALIQAVPQIIGAFIAAVPKILSSVGDVFTGLFTDILPKLLAGLGGVVTAIGTWIVQNGPNILAKLGEWTTQFITWVADLVVKLPIELLKLIGGILSWIGTNGPNILLKLGEWTIQFIAWIGGLIIKIPIELAKLWLKIAGWIVGVAVQIPGKVAAWGGAFFGWIGDVIKLIPGKLGEIWTKISGWIAGLPGKITTAARGMWDGIGTAFKTAINWIIEKWNGFEIKIGGWTIPGPFGTSVDLPTIDVKMPKIPTLATGGVVAATAGGVLARIAEGGHNEVVKPLDSYGMTASDRLISAMLREQRVQMDRLVSGLMGRSGTGIAPTIVNASTNAAIVAAQHAVTGRGPGNEPGLTTEIGKLTKAVDALQKPLVGGDLVVQAAPGERAEESVPRALRRRAYTRGGAR